MHDSRRRLYRYKREESRIHDPVPIGRHDFDFDLHGALAVFAKEEERTARRSAVMSNERLMGDEGFEPPTSSM